MSEQGKKAKDEMATVAAIGGACASVGGKMIWSFRAARWVLAGETQMIDVVVVVLL